MTGVRAALAAHGVHSRLVAVMGCYVVAVLVQVCQGQWYARDGMCRTVEYMEGFVWERQ